jgi:hypothetical protein
VGLVYKPDWDETKERFIAWWSGEYFGRCAIAVTAPRAQRPDVKPPTAPSDPIRRWTDLDYIAALNEHHHAATFYGGEAFPIWSGGYPGHTSIPAFLGCPITLDHTTGWWDPILDDDDWNVTSLSIDTEGRWWKFTLELLDTAATASAGKSIPSTGAFGGAGDTLAALRGTGRLLYDVMDCPERVAAAELHLMRQWCEVYDAFYQIVHPAAQGSTGWFPLWSPGKFYASQCDFSYMISPRMFRELFVPAIEMQTQFLDHSVYHLDGIGAFVHVPALLEIPGIQAIQVGPGAGKPSALHYLDLLRQIQAGGKNLWISLAADEVERALSLLSVRGLFIDTSCGSEEEARALLKAVETWSRP